MEFIEKLKRRKNNYFHQIKVGKYWLSIQGSDMHYSLPRETLKKEKYRCLEIVIFNEKGWFNISKSKILREWKNLNTLLKYSDGEFTGTQVFCYVSIQLIEDLYQFLKEK